VRNTVYIYTLQKAKLLLLFNTEKIVEKTLKNVYHEAYSFSMNSQENK